MKPKIANVQTAEDGAGPLYHRLYVAEFKSSWSDCMRAMLQLQRDLNSCSPQAIASFVKTKGAAEVLADLDEFEVKLSAPADAPVAVKGVTRYAFILVTLEGHIEAGEIKFQIKKVDDSTVKFQIESLARSRNGVVDFLYDKIPIARMAQGIMWTEFCKNFVRLTVGDEHAENAEVTVLTEKQLETGGEWLKA